MILGLTSFELVILAAVVLAMFMVGAGVIGVLWPRRAPSGDVLDVKFGKFAVKTNVMAVSVLLGGIGVLSLAGYGSSLATPHFPLSGKVTLDDGRTVSGISVGLIPPEHSTDTTATGTVRLDVPRPSGNGATGTYKAVVYYNDGKRLRAEIAPVNVDRNWVATIDHRFGRQ